MKKIFSITFAAIAVFALTMACTKEINSEEETLRQNNQEQVTPPTGKPITISATLLDTKVSFTPEFDANHKPTSMSHKWESGDRLRVTDANDPGNSAVFELIRGDGTSTGVFQGTIADAASYDVEVIPVGTPSVGDTQEQAKDGDTSHLRFVASATGVTDLKSFTLTETSSIIGFIAKLPADVAVTINQLVIEKSTDNFETRQTLTIDLKKQEDVNADDILEVYANIPASWSIAADSKMILRFGSKNANHTVYTRYQEFASAPTLTPGKFNYIKINCSKTDKHAGAPSCDGTSTDMAYLIGDPYQVAAINGLATPGSTTFFKMIDDVDMKIGDKYVAHNSINTDKNTTPTYNKAVNFNGNNKKISNLQTHLFYVFKGSISNLTLKGSNTSSRGVFAEFCQETGHTITNVDILASTMTGTDNNSGALIGRINSGTEGVISATIQDCDVINTTVRGGAQTGGLIGCSEQKIVIDNCTVSSSDNNSSSVTASGNNCGGLIGQTKAETTITNCSVSGTNVEGTAYVGGVVGNTSSIVNISGSKYLGGTITASVNYVGGFVGTTGDFSSTFSNCQVENSTINVNYTQDARGGGFVGLLQTSVVVSGCSVGTATNKVTINTKEPTKTNDKYNVINVGGFAGVCYGKITQNGDVRSKAYVKITSTNTQGTPLKIGGFVGFHSGIIEHCDAIVDMSDLKGQHIGGFAGYITKQGNTKPGNIDDCTSTGSVSGNNYTGGFIGYLDANGPAISNCSVSGTVKGQSGAGGFVGQSMSGIFTACSSNATCTFTGSNNGGFAGQIHGGALTGCSSTGAVSFTGGSTHGGFIGLIPNGTISIDRCYAGGDVSSSATNVSPFLANINQSSGNTVNITINNCYSTGNIDNNVNGNQIRGGLVGTVTAATSLSISNCYASGAVVGSFRLGGLIGNLGIAAATVKHCVAWNSEVTASDIASNKWSSAAVIGTAFPSCTLTDNYRRPGIPITAYWGNVTGYTYFLANDYQHANVDPDHTLIKHDGTHTTATALASGQDGYPQYPYHGKVEAGKTLSQLASTTLGWPSEVWDFSGDRPTLKDNPE